MINGEKPGNRLQQRSIDSPASAKWTAMGEDSRRRLDKSSAGTRWGNQNGEPSPGIQLLGATAVDHLGASEKVVEAFVIWFGECQGLLGASLEGITERERYPRMLNAQAGAAAVVAAEEWHSYGAWMTATGSPRHEGRNCTPGVVYCDEPSDPANPGPLPISTLPKHATMQTWLMRIGTDIVNVEMLTDDGGRIPAQYQEMSYPRVIQGLCGCMPQRYGNSRTTPFNASKENSRGRAPWEEGERKWQGTQPWGTTQIAWIYEISERGSETKSWER